MTTKIINDLPPFTPHLPDFRLAEFHRQSLELLKFPIEHDQAALDLAPFQIDPPTPPPDPPLPLLPHVWYPKPIQAVRDWSFGRLMPTRPTAFVGKVRTSQAQSLMDPLLAGEGPVTVRGELGMGKTTLLQFVATHERTTRRYRRVWWLDDPAMIIQSLALALNVPQVLMLQDRDARLEVLRDALDDNTLLVIDNLTPDEAEQFRSLTHHLLLGVEMEANVLLEEDDEPFPDPPGIVTLRPLPRTDGLDLMAHVCGITDTKQVRGQMRAWLTHLVKLVDGNPLAIVIAGALFREDHLPMEKLIDTLDARMSADDPKPYLAIDLSYDALPPAYTELLMGLAALPPNGATFEAIMAAARVRNPIAGYRGLAFLAKRGFIRRDERPGERYIAHPFIWQRLNRQDLHASGHKVGERVQQWALSTARRYSEDAAQIYRFQDELLHTLTQARRHRMEDVVHKLNMTLGSYFREYAPDFLAEDGPPPRLMGERAQAAKLMQDSLDYLKVGSIDRAQKTIDEALNIAEKHSSNHEVAEILVVAAMVDDEQADYPQAIQRLERAAKLIFELDNESSLHVLRLGLAMLYRKQGRYKDALGVLDDGPDTFGERARIFRAMESWDQMLEALSQAGNLTPVEKAESYLLAGRYADALEALAERRDSISDHLRARIFHLQGNLENAIRGYQQAIEALAPESPPAMEACLAMGTAYAAQQDFRKAETEFQRVLEVQNRRSEPDAYLKGKALSLLASLNLVEGNPNRAIELAEEGLAALQQSPEQDTHRVQADSYRTIGRANWRLERVKLALSAFEGEVDQAQSVPHRDEQRIGVALHHLAHAYHRTDELDRAIANYRRALTHKDADEKPLSYFMTQIALYQALFEAERYEDALEVIVAATKDLDSRPPADLQHLGYALSAQVETFEALGQDAEARRVQGRWLSVLAGRSDALQDERPALNLLALNLATRSMIASQRADEALSLAEIALSIAEHHHASTDIAWSSRRDLGEIHIALENWQRAIDIFAVIFHEENVVNSYTDAYSHQQAAVAHWQLGNLEMAIEHYTVALERHPEPLHQALIMEKMADVYLDLRQTDEAIAITQKAADTIDAETFTGDAARIHTRLAQLYAGSNHFSEAVQVYEDALTMLRAMPEVDSVHMARVYASLGESNVAQGQYPEAAIAYRNALDTLDHTPGLATDDHRQVLVKLADVRVALEQPDEAIVLYQQARDETEHYGTELELGAVTTKLADLYRDTGQFEEALYYYEQALELQPASTVPRERAATLRGYGRTLAQVEAFEDARSAWNQALAITTDAPPLEVALTHRAIGQAYRAQEMFGEAEQAFREALAHHEPNTVQIAETLRLYGATLIEAGRFSDAINPLVKALDIEEGLSQQVNIRIVQTLELLAFAQEKHGDINAAITSYHKALVYMDATHQPIPIANRLRTLGRLYTIQKQWKEAHKALEDALQIEFDTQPRSDTRIAQTLEMIALAYRREGHLEKAADTYKRMASYANLSKTASAELKTTLDELDRQRGTLEAARQSLAVLERTSADVKDIAHVYALLAQTEAGLANFDASNEAIEQLLSTIEHHADSLDTADPRPEYRALAHVFEGSQAASTGELAEARAHFQRALHETENVAFQWVIQRGLDSVRER